MTGQATNREMALALTGVILLETTMARPLGAGHLLSTAAPWAVLLAALLAALMLWPAAGAAAGRGLGALALESGGRPAAVATAFLLTGALLPANAVKLRQIAELAGAALDPQAGQTLAAIGLLAAAAAGAAAGPPGLIWATAAVACATLPIVLAVLAANLGWADWRHLFPISGHGLIPASVHMLPLTGHYGAGVLPLMLGAALPEGIRPARRALAGAIVAAAAITALAAAAELMVLPEPGGAAVPYPFLEMARMALGPATAASLWLAAATLSSAAILALTLQALAILWRDAFCLPAFSTVIGPLAALTLALSYLSGLQAWNGAVILGLPLLLTLGALLRRRGAGGRR